MKRYKFPRIDTATINQGYGSLEIVRGIANVDETNVAQMQIVKQFDAVLAPNPAKKMAPKKGGK